jgi:hypothetical protein
MGLVADPDVLADRVHRFSAPVSVIARALTEDRGRWLEINPGEELPDVVENDAHRVVWSSFWPVSPRDTIEFDLTRRRSGCEMRFRWRSDLPPDERGIGITRQRLNRKLASDLRGWLTTDEAWRDTKL